MLKTVRGIDGTNKSVPVGKTVAKLGSSTKYSPPGSFMALSEHSNHFKEMLISISNRS